MKRGLAYCAVVAASLVAAPAAFAGTPGAFPSRAASSLAHRAATSQTLSRDYYAGYYGSPKHQIASVSSQLTVPSVTCPTDTNTTTEFGNLIFDTTGAPQAGSVLVV